VPIFPHSPPAGKTVFYLEKFLTPRAREREILDIAVEDTAHSQFILLIKRTVQNLQNLKKDKLEIFIVRETPFLSHSISHYFEFKYCGLFHFLGIIEILGLKITNKNRPYLIFRDGFAILLLL
jgi:hypothetical protein